MEEIHDSIPEHLKCPICFEIPQDKVFQCRRGHIFCEGCNEKLPDNICPQCRVYLPKNPIRCRAVEETLDSLKLEFPCKFQSAGCEMKLDRKEIAEHSLSCKYDFEKFGHLRNVCGIFGFKNCSFKFNMANTEEAVAHFKSVHKMRSPKAFLLNKFTVIYEDFKNIYSSNETTVFTPLIFDQKWWGHNGVYIIVTRFNPLDKTLQFASFYLILGWRGWFLPQKNARPKPVEFDLGNLIGTVHPQHLLYFDGQTLNDSCYFVAPVKRVFNVDKPNKFSSTLLLKELGKQHGNFQRLQNEGGLDKCISYGVLDVLNPNLLHERWPTFVRPVCSGGVPQNWDQIQWISHKDYKECKNRFSSASFSLEMDVLICRAKINEKWLVGVVGINKEKNMSLPAYFRAPSLLNSTQVYHLNDNFEILYTPPNSSAWAPWTALQKLEPIPVHDEEKDLLISETRRTPHLQFIGGVKNDMQPDDDVNLHVFVRR